ncbi:acyl-CoA N-acyltransferase [Aspergillus ambiguus]|uniref:GNAT family N-acetyltransferase n=1 Tax=Aspergillus ambiguus TaxID=176160 RepID=UPI003CCDDF67
MRNNVVHLPNGQFYSATPVFGGVTFKSNDTRLHSSIPPGWTVVIYTRQAATKKPEETDSQERPPSRGREGTEKDDARSSTRFTIPTLQDDCLYLSYIINPPDTDYKPVTSPSRQIAMMLWVTLWWYFHEDEPSPYLDTDASSHTPTLGKPKGSWRINIKREGIFKGRNVLAKLERMGLISTEDSAVGADPYGAGLWDNLFVSRRTFWQIDPRLFLFTLNPQHAMAGSFTSRLASPTRENMYLPDANAPTSNSDQRPFTPKETPYTSGSHLPTYYPPPPTQYTFTNGVRHPVRPKPPHQGEVFYVRYIPSVQQYLSFRVPYLHAPDPRAGRPGSAFSSPTIHPDADPSLSGPSDLELLHKWMNDPRVNASWGEGGPISKQEAFLRGNLDSRHSFPVIGCWNGKPFGYFEIYWVKEDRLGPLIGNATNYDRGIHLLIGEQEFRGPHRVAIWLSALVHYCWLADSRTETVMLEPRVDNEKVIGYLQRSGFYKEGEVTFAHKQSALMKIKRDSWEAPVL